VKIRLIKHEVFPDRGSYEVRFPDGQSKYFKTYRRRLRPDLVEQAIAKQDVKQCRAQTGFAITG
jgi:hypothetical protein